MVTVILTDSPEGDFGVVQKRKEESKSPVWGIVAEKPTISNIAHHRVCLQWASQIFYYEKVGNYLKFVGRCRHWRRSRFRKEIRKF